MNLSRNKDLLVWAESEALRVAQAMLGLVTDEAIAEQKANPFAAIERGHSNPEEYSVVNVAIQRSVARMCAEFPDQSPASIGFLLGVHTAQKILELKKF